MGRLLRHLDYYGLLLVLALSTFGVLAIASATAASGRSQLARNQVSWLAIGLVVMTVVMSIDYRKVAGHAGLLYASTTGLLVAILLYGRVAKGAQRWLDLGFLRFQPSELAKVTLALVLAKYVASIKGSHLRFVELCVIGTLTAVPMGLVALQPDLGTAITFAPIAFVMAFMGGIRLRYYVILALVLAVAVPTVYVFGLRDYQRERIHTFLDPERDPQDAGWQVRQSLIAVGSGGPLGKGYGKGTQTRLHFVPEQHTDFVFTVWAEEMGFLGTGVAIGLYLLLTGRVIGTASVSRDWLGALICCGFAGSIAFQAMANLCMVVNLIPTTGIPLPLMSYGGTSVLATMLFLGLVLSVRIHRYDIR